MVRPGVTGFLYEPGNLSQFVEYLFLLGVDDERRSSMGQAARGYVKAHFRFESMVESYMHLFNSTQAERRSALF